MEVADGSIPNVIDRRIADVVGDPSWRTTLAGFDLATVRTYDDARRILQARYDAAQAEWIVEHGNNIGFQRSNDGLSARAPLAMAMKIDGGDSLQLPGVVIFVATLDEDMQALAWRSLVEHGANTGTWPADVRSKLANATRAPSNRDVLTRLRQTFERDVGVAASRALKAYGRDPASWSIEALDEIARVQARRSALTAIADQALAEDGEWLDRKSARAAIVDEPEAA